ncbi:N-acetyl-gamma-glutamyl-phosphate reductase [Echinimonas agarilytica]|uniref:N-acetyl-gamma-glutamyl-phosphate reductase n=1 Tax=Echinimonas agarilytica TaxID=1215918 RepID=A0AA41W3V2_9GAMM|nr:N-acetyl-gamma-glutamyl-phosphate reductase [Echinimonas agarilytica]MCM2678327.1 N-acetyl-gamma-glutamyl-phosphate reductase [Echinimonas agarilytica]
MTQNIRCAVIGASGYTGVELAALIARHPQMSLGGVYVSEASLDANKPLSQLHGRFLGLLDTPLTPLSEEAFAAIGTSHDVVFLATEHQVSTQLAPKLLAQGLVVMDLSGGFRFADADIYPQYYGFDHAEPELLKKAVYGLAEWNAESIKTANLVAVPGCYPTATLSALKPLKEAGLLDTQQYPVVNAVSGVTGAGRKASMVNSFCEVSLHPYGILGHRHQPEIGTHLGQDVIFTPHLGNFPRGIVSTVTVKLASDVTQAQVTEAYQNAYAGSKCVRLYDEMAGQSPSIKNVVGTSHCDLGWKVDETSGHAVLVAAIDNLLKGAAGQAIQCANLRFGLIDFPLEAAS